MDSEKEGASATDRCHPLAMGSLEHILRASGADFLLLYLYNAVPLFPILIDYL